MEYLQNLYGRIFGQTTVEGYEPRKIVAFGNVLLDRTAQLTDNTLLDRFQLQAGSKGELDAETLAKISAEACGNYDCVTNPGGSALNTVRILRKLGTDALFFGSVGDDKNAEELKKLLSECDVEARLKVNIGVPTGQCVCLVTDDSKSATMYANVGASEKFSVDFLRRAAVNESQTFLRPIERKQVLYIEGFFVPKREEVCEYIVQHYIRERRRLALNLSAVYIVQQNYEQILHLARHAFFIFGNANEFGALMELMRVESLDELGEKLLEGNNVKVIVVTKGADGVHVISNFVDEHAEPGAISHQTYNAPRVSDVVDPTGAGDAFVAAFLNAWMQKRSVSECVRIATDVAAKVVTQIGCNLPE